MGVEMGVQAKEEKTQQVSLHRKKSSKLTVHVN